MLEERVENLNYLLSTYYVQNTALNTVHILIFLTFTTYLLGGDYQPHLIDEAETLTQTCPNAT